MKLGIIRKGTENKTKDIIMTVPKLYSSLISWVSCAVLLSFQNSYIKAGKGSEKSSEGDGID